MLTGAAHTSRLCRSMFPIEYRKPHDVSFDKDKSMMRCQITRGAGEDARDGSEVVVHFTVHAPNEDGSETLVFDSARTSRSGIRFTLGETLHAEVIERAILGMPPGSVVDVICTDTDAARDPELRIEPPVLGSKATDKIVTLQRKEFSEKVGSSIMPDRNKEYAEEARRWKPPETMTRWNVRLDSARGGVVPAYITWPQERLDWTERQKSFGTVLFQRGLYARAGRRYKKAMLDLEIPTEWAPETNIERNRLRLSLHLNIAACCLRTRDFDGAIFHATRALRTQPKNVKALFRRGSAHLALFRERATALDAALADLEMARQLDPDNKEVAIKLAEARARQKQVGVGAAHACSD